MDDIFRSELEYYKRCLAHPTIGEQGRLYLKKRGINQETIDRWEIGFSPYGCVPTIYKDKDVHLYKKMYNRIVFPIYDQHGRIISISGRLTIISKEKPKYDHYPFPARKVLFGLYQNKESIRTMNRSVITEGQLDVITAWQNGFPIATSSFGAHGSQDHIALLSRYCDLIDVLYDADNAGDMGVEGIKKLSTLGDVEVRFQKPFNKGDDLDSWISKNSADELYKLLDIDKNSSIANKLKAIKRGAK